MSQFTESSPFHSSFETFGNARITFQTHNYQSTYNFLETIELRVKKVEEFCEVRNNQGCQVNNILVLKEKNLVWCPVYKSGTSAWMTNLVHLSQQSPKEKERLIGHHGGIGNTN